MAQSKSSKQWLREHFSDPFVKASKVEGYRSRAVYKLLAIQEKDKIFRPGMKVVDLGAAPGGWSQLARELIGTKGEVYALDILPMPALPGVEFIQGDFTQEAVFNDLSQRLEQQKIDVLLSDMAPNMSGMKDVDQYRAMNLAELAFEMAKQLLKTNGVFVVKVFQGEGFDLFYHALKKAFKTANIRKPPASRSRSNETYVVAKGFKGIISSETSQ